MFFAHNSWFYFWLIDFGCFIITFGVFCNLCFHLFVSFRSMSWLYAVLVFCVIPAVFALFHSIGCYGFYYDNCFDSSYELAWQQWNSQTNITSCYWYFQQLWLSPRWFPATGKCAKKTSIVLFFLIAAQNVPSNKGMLKQREHSVIQVRATQCRELGICKVARILGDFLYHPPPTLLRHPSPKA